MEKRTNKRKNTMIINNMTTTLIKEDIINLRSIFHNFHTMIVDTYLKNSES